MTVTIAVPETLTCLNRQPWKADVLKAIESGARDLVFDLSGTRYVDAGGLGTMVSLSKRLRERHGLRPTSVTLRHPNADVAALLELTKLGTLFRVEWRPMVTA